MIEVLEFVFRDVPTFIGTVILLMIIGFCIMNIRLFSINTFYYDNSTDDER